MSKMHIRTANIHDIKALTSLMEQLGYPTTEDQMTGRLQALAAHPSYPTLVAEKDGHVVGMRHYARANFMSMMVVMYEFKPLS